MSPPTYHHKPQPYSRESSYDSTPFVSPIPSDDATDSSDSKRWARMLRMQKEFHCYRSARLEAAVETLERGEEPPIRESI